MGKAILIILLLVGLCAAFRKAAEWFQENKNINIIPAAFIEMIAAIIFMFTYGSTYTDEIVWMWIAVAIIVAITIFNLIKYGLKDGILASLAELIFSAAAALLILSYLVVRSERRTKRRKR